MLPPSTVRTLVSRDFYNRSPDLVARDLLGKLIVRTYRGKPLVGRIIETEAYLGADDPASHAYIGQTPRNSVMFGPAGFAYVYFIYGMHFCLNVSCQPAGTPGGVLFRALLPVEGVGTMAQLRKQLPTAKSSVLTGGPGKICQAMGITIENSNGLDFTDAKSPLRIEDDGHPLGAIDITPRIGLTKAADLPLRFLARPLAT